MKLITSKQVDLNAIDISRIDVIICALGYESRCTVLTRMFLKFSLPTYVLEFDNYLDNPQRIINNKFFQKKGFNNILIKGDEDDKLVELLDLITSEFTGRIISILIDYSSMTSIFYASILKYFANCNKLETVRLFFSYTHSKYTPSHSSSIISRNVGPINGYVSLTIPDKPTALIIGLGYEKGKAFGLSEYLDAETYIFYTEQEKDNLGYTADVEKQNKELIAYFNKDNIIKYSIFNLELTQNLLYQICSDLYEDYRIILAPCGPKPFTLLCLITTLEFSNIDVWRISTGKESEIYDRKSNGKFSVIECVFRDK